MKRTIGFVIIILAILLVPKDTLASSFFSGTYKISCVESPNGCACFSAPSSHQTIARFFHGQPVEGVLPIDQTTSAEIWTELKVNDQTCFYPTQELRPIHWESDLCPTPENEANVPLRDADEMLAEGTVNSEKLALGLLYPTFYNIADENFHNGAKTNPLYERGTGTLIATVAESFQEDLDIEGTGVLRDGRVLNVGKRTNGKWSYVVLPVGAFGVGILKHKLHPYRSVAVDFTHLCKQAELDFCLLSDAEIRRRLIGAVLYIPRLKGISLPNGKTHDGFVCAQDVGGSIKGDRIDLFVGPLGGGNPYLKDCRQENPYNRVGIHGLVPFDWRTFVRNGVNSKGAPKFQRVDEFEYRIYAKQKALDSYLIKGAFCKP